MQLQLDTVSVPREYKPQGKNYTIFYFDVVGYLDGEPYNGEISAVGQKVGLVAPNGTVTVEPNPYKEGKIQVAKVQMGGGGSAPPSFGGGQSQKQAAPAATMADKFHDLERCLDAGKALATGMGMEDSHPNYFTCSKELGTTLYIECNRSGVQISG